MGIILGIDAGARSIGWTLVYQDDSARKGKVIDMGVRIFQPGLENYNTKDEASRTAKRRLKRGARRVHARRKWRRRQTLFWLDEMGFIQLKARVALEDLRKHLPDEFFESDPYRLRFEALGRKLEPLEFARVIFHLAQRRGFLSNRKANGKDDEGKSLKVEFDAISESWDSVKDRFPTWGAFCHAVNTGAAAFPEEIVKEAHRIREKHTKRAWFIEEFDRIWEVQRQHYSELLTDAQRDRIRDEILFFQRPLQAGEELVGYCTFEFESREKRMPHGHPLAQRFRMLSDINSIRIAPKNAAADMLCPLIDNEREALLAALGSQLTSLKVDKVRTILKKCQPEKQAIRTNFDDEHSVKFFKPLATLVRLRKILGSGLSEAKAIQVFETWNLAETDEVIAAKFREVLPDASEEQIEALLEFSPEPGYGRLGKTATTKILPHLEAGMIYSKACEAAGYNHSDIGDMPEGT